MSYIIGLGSLHQIRANLQNHNVAAGLCCKAAMPQKIGPTPINENNFAECCFVILDSHINYSRTEKQKGVLFVMRKVSAPVACSW